MTRAWFGFVFALAAAAALPFADSAPALSAQASTCNLTAYKRRPGWRRPSPAMRSH